MYANQSSYGQSRTTGLATVVFFHVALVGVLVTLKQPVPQIFDKPPLVVTFVPDISVPSEPLPLPPAPEEVSLSEPLPQDAFQLPELPLPAELPASTPSGSVSASTSSPSLRATDIRKSAALPGKLEKPPYPRISETLNEEGVSTIEACITAKGRVSSARLVESSGYARLDEAAVKWVRTVSGFKPATVNGKPVAECMIIPLEWKIEVR